MKAFKESATAIIRAGAQMVNQIKVLILLVCLVAIICYWEHTGQMLASAATPSLHVCAALMGFCVGKCCKSK